MPRMTKDWFETKDKTGKKIAFPLVVLEGDRKGPTVTVVAGIHGTEYPSIAAAMRLVQSLQKEDLAGTIRIVTIANMPSFTERSMFVTPPDGKNLNRVFPGNADGSYTEALGYYLFNKVFKGSDYLIDVHTGDMVEEVSPMIMYNKVGDEGVDSRSKALAEAMDYPFIFEMSLVGGGWTGAGTVHAAAAANGIAAVIAEAGGSGKTDDASTRLHYQGVINAFRAIGCLDGKPIRMSRPAYFTHWEWARCPEAGFFRPTVHVCDWVRKGQQVGVLEDYFGETICSLESPTDGCVAIVTTCAGMQKDAQAIAVGVPKA